MTKEFFVYSKPNCPWCSLVLHVLDIATVPVVHSKIDEAEERAAFMKDIQHVYNTDQNTFPVVFVDDTLIGGCTETIEWLKTNNYKVSLI